MHLSGQTGINSSSGTVDALQFREEFYMHSFWSGSISFGLVNIPVQVFSAAEEREISLHYLHKKDLSPIRFAKICKEEEREVPYKDIVRGYEIKKDQYVLVTAEDIKNAAPEKTNTIELVHFVDECDIDLVYAAKPYYLKPEKRAQKAYALLKKALTDSGKVGIAQFIFRTKENVGVIKSYGDVLVLNQLRFYEEIRSSKDLEFKAAPKVSGRELAMAKALIAQLTQPFEIERYKDTYSNKLLSVIKRKSKGQQVISKEPEPQQAKVYNLMDALRTSLAKEGKEGRSRKTRKKAA